jgi:ectoine hydroxylase-related dioxygenase (phytanoyl-CoA dioxygenase family)
VKGLTIDAEGFRRDGHTVVRGLGPVDEVAAVRPAVAALVEARRARMGSIDERDTYGKAFVQAMNLWCHSDAVATFVRSPRYAAVAAELLGVESVRLYHDQALFKEPGGGPTPWHQDQVYWPLDTGLPGGGTVTMWMPLVDVPAEVGSMTFADGTHLLGDLGGGVIADRSEEALDEVVRARGLSTTTHGAMRAGDATFHAGWTLHRAGPNPSVTMREVMTVIYVAADARIGPIEGPQHAWDHRLWLDARPVGGPIDGPLNPVLWP